ncbi:MAG: FhaA domain-containing protein [Actinomycetales bacterium]
MGVLARFERRIEELVNGAFAKAFRSDVQPVEIASALQRECDDKAAIVARGRTLAPNVFHVELGAHDFERLSAHEAALATELATMVADHASSQGYTLLGPVGVGFEEVDDLETGVFRVRGESVAQVETTGPRKRVTPPVNRPAVEQTMFLARPVPAADREDDAAPAVAAAVRPPELEIAGRRLPLTHATTVLGRGRDVDVRIDDPGVSRRHAEVRVQGQLAEVVDLGSTNGIVVGGHRRDRAVLEDGTTFQIGSTAVTFWLPDDPRSPRWGHP